MPLPVDNAPGITNLTSNQVQSQTPSADWPLLASEVSKSATGNIAQPKFPEDSISNFSLSTEKDSALLPNRYRTPFPQDSPFFLDNGNLPSSPTQSSSVWGRSSSRGPKTSQFVETIGTGHSLTSTRIPAGRRTRSQEHQDGGPPRKRRVNKRPTSQDFPPEDLPPQDLPPNSERPFSCPYFKRNPARYHACRQRQCKGINRLKSVP